MRPKDRLGALQETIDMITDRQQQIIDLISAEIMAAAVHCAVEQHTPAYSADESDAYIKDRMSVVIRLRVVRGMLERVFSGLIQT